MASMRRAAAFVRNGFAAVGIVTVSGAWAIKSASSTYQQRVKEASIKLPDNFLLELDFETTLVKETTSFDPLALIGQGPNQLAARKIVKALKEASGDDRVRGVIAYVGDASSSMGLAVAQELRSAVTDFREKTAGRAAVIAYSDAFGEAGMLGTTSYYLASSFDKVYMQPTGLLSLTGLAAEGMFFKNLLSRWNVKTDVIRREEYKSAVEPFTEERFSGPAREALQQLLNSLASSIAEGVATSRKLTIKAMEAAVDEAPLSATKAVAMRLIDGAKYRDEAVAEATSGWTDEGKKPERVPLSRYLRAIERAAVDKSKQDSVRQAVQELMKEGQEDGDSSEDGKPEVAVVHVEGPITRGSPASSSTSPQVDSVKLCRTLQKLHDSKSVKAVVMRVDSPGGSAVASDCIHREVERLTAAGKPVIVSMGNVAASGGYFISAPATKIVAQPTTITGSIGVLFGKLNINGGLAEVGVSTDSVAVGRNALAMSSLQDFTPEQRQQAEANVEDIYGDFVGKVSKGRRLSPEATLAAAKGRVWSGKDALQLGLVDQLGGLQDAILLARQEAKLPVEDEKVEVVDYPKVLTPQRMLTRLFRGEPLEMAAPGLTAPLPPAQAVLLAVALAAPGNGSLPASLMQQLTMAGSPPLYGVQLAAVPKAGPQMLCELNLR